MNNKPLARFERIALNVLTVAALACGAFNISVLYTIDQSRKRVECYEHAQTAGACTEPSAFELAVSKAVGAK